MHCLSNRNLIFTLSKFGDLGLASLITTSVPSGEIEHFLGLGSFALRRIGPSLRELLIDQPLPPDSPSGA
jgi:hypothetical protein